MATHPTNDPDCHQGLPELGQVQTKYQQKTPAPKPKHRLPYQRASRWARQHAGEIAHEACQDVCQSRQYRPPGEGLVNVAGRGSESDDTRERYPQRQQVKCGARNYLAQKNARMTHRPVQ